MTTDPDLVLPVRLVGPSLTAAGLAAWVLAQGGDEAAAERTGELQDRIDEALRAGANEVRLPRSVVSRAEDLWTEAARLADAWAAAAGSDRAAAGWGQHAARLRTRAQSLGKLLR